VSSLRGGQACICRKTTGITLTKSELDEIEQTYIGACTKEQAPLLMVGFNRRYAPQVQKIKTLLESVKVPKSFIMTVNAGDIPPEHWTQQKEIGGGRIIGEACHFIDLLRFLADSPIISIQAIMIGEVPGVAVRDDKVSFSLGFEDGSFGTVHYLANGNKSFPKERLEIFCDGRVLQLDNFRKLRGFGWPGFKKMNLWQQDKGQVACVAAFVEAIQQGRMSPIAFEELLEVTRVSFEVSNYGSDLKQQNLNLLYSCNITDGRFYGQSGSGASHKLTDKEFIMQALREIHDVTLNQVTINIPPTFPFKRVEIVVLPMTTELATTKKDPWQATNKFREQLEHSKRVFSDSAELIREDRDR
jgi:hypothetical protein